MSISLLRCPSPCSGGHLASLLFWSRNVPLPVQPPLRLCLRPPEWCSGHVVALGRTPTTPPHPRPAQNCTDANCFITLGGVNFWYLCLVVPAGRVCPLGPGEPCLLFVFSDDFISLGRRNPQHPQPLSSLTPSSGEHLLTGLLIGDRAGGGEASPPLLRGTSPIRGNSTL